MFKLKFIYGEGYYFYYSLDGVKFTLLYQGSTTSYIPDMGVNVGINRNSDGAFLTNGYADLNSFKIYVDGELVYSPTRPTTFLERRKEGFNLSKFTVVGSQTIIENEVYTCGYDEASYVKVSFDNTLNSFSLDFEINIPDISQNGYYFTVDGKEVFTGAKEKFYAIGDF